jgi:hypothetical protein
MLCQFCVRDFLKRHDVFPNSAKSYMPSSASEYEIELFEQEGIEPYLNDLRLDWTFENARWNSTVFSILADELGRWLENGRLPPIGMKHARALAKENGFGNDTSSMLEDRIMKMLKNQEKNVQRHWGFRTVNVAPQRTETSMSGLTLEKAMSRMRSRRRGVRDFPFKNWQV